MKTIAIGLGVFTSTLVAGTTAHGQATAPAPGLPEFGLPVLRTVALGAQPAWLAERTGSHSRATPALAEDAWQQSFAPYLWVPGMEGKITVKGNVAPINSSIGDTIDALDELDMAFIGHYEARLGDGGFMGDAVYLDLPAEGTLPSGNEAELDFSATIVELGGFLELERWDEDPLDAAACALEVIGGARMWYLATELDVDGLGIHASGHEFWADPFIGLRLLTQLDERWGLNLRADVGGFGIFNGSDMTWEAIATVTYATSETGQLALGWRTLAVDYDHGNFELNADLSGPFLGYNFQF